MSFSTLKGALLGVALTATLAATAQTMPPPARSAAQEATAATPLLPPGQAKGGYKNYLRQRYADDREARAIIHLFKRKQRGGLLWMGTMGGLMGFLAAKSGTHTNADGSTSTLTVTPLGWGVQVGLFAGVGLRKEIRFSNHQLYRTLAAHDSGQPIPLYVDNKLKDKDYR